MWSQCPWVSSTLRTPSDRARSSSRWCSLAASSSTASPVSVHRSTNTLLASGPTTILWISKPSLAWWSVVMSASLPVGARTAPPAQPQRSESAFSTSKGPISTTCCGYLATGSDVTYFTYPWDLSLPRSRGETAPAHAHRRAPGGRQADRHGCRRPQRRAGLGLGEKPGTGRPGFLPPRAPSGRGRRDDLEAQRRSGRDLAAIERGVAGGPGQPVGSRQVDGVDRPQPVGRTQLDRLGEAALVDRDHEEGVPVVAQPRPQPCVLARRHGEAVERQQGLRAAKRRGAPRAVVRHGGRHELTAGRMGVAPHQCRGVEEQRHVVSSTRLTGTGYGPRSSSSTASVRTSTGASSASGAAGRSRRPGGRTNPAATRSSSVTPARAPASNGPICAAGTPSTVTTTRSPAAPPPPTPARLLRRPRMPTPAM